MAESAIRSLRRGFSELDGKLFDAVADSSSPLLDHTMRPLSAAADHSVLWMAIAAGMSTGGLSLRRGAVRGLASLAVTSLVVNQGLKRIYPRARPAFAGVPVKRARRQPTSNSFPSGHAASAAAFAVGVGLENHSAGYLLGALAAAVGLSRVATGAHYPADVLAGFAVGAGIAAAGARLVPPVDEGCSTTPAPTVEQVRPAPDGAGLVVILNPSSGDGTGRRVANELRAALPGAEIVELEPGADVAAIAAEAASRAEFLGVAGGDGTVATVAAQAVAADTPLAVFPAGTFNHFAKDIGSDTVSAAVDFLRRGMVTRVDVVWLNEEKMLLNTASIGAYPEFVRTRSRLQRRRIGRPSATVRAILKVLRNSAPVRVRIGGRPVTVSFFFLGNSQYGAAGFVPGRRSRLDDGMLDVRYLEDGHRNAAARLLLSWLSGRITTSKIYREVQAPEVTIEADRPFRVAHDGEAGDLHTRAHFRVGHRALRVFGRSEVG
ncbi:Phosphoesterase PA-phosphatase related protein OS=Tsukamurella paurometabola (strain ATCC 8368 / DSM / CCUG 35730 / CIP 100753 / JCM 10117 / KCTC 9821 /NBRC 16120 / NCIMB 702349 / NCTC 13040) OX=521096 GN=Tpau_0196 PE=4 SV=1 [Tsukamurella paurometabola]|uniref:Phosphoesterase PA-phosphatase related protein n=1 Tax=Tsukamurella paurometabola (strain ATCC 8368 / DSM 20162 / CCUG 35730 / CIP 100753 / JCM 10117 / KCTC 9821 / NBRC 16120 / NCIMB 702349 / NCTC 13040) TaxID=521096 RepID=D5UQL7_TSUPD|nr:bifunctional phosphatase PAP2/diacylglycerol kinase family protein [Tsukamurella paurometabola]ADG76850.1 phosphoesterase PA-phosphatase related protein [Tsukamurella paurometabola DSM 20162]SUP41908.1 Putative lipid kinase BmrU [Tsukamurella paurometabola]